MSRTVDYSREKDRPKIAKLLSGKILRPPSYIRRRSRLRNQSAPPIRSSVS